MRYSQKKVALFDMDTYPVKLHNTVPCKCFDMGEGETEWVHGRETH